MFRRGDRVVPSGIGRTKAWPLIPGTVTRRLTKTSVEVVWDNTRFGDEMEEDEIRRVEGEGDPREAEERQYILLEREEAER